MVKTCYLTEEEKDDSVKFPTNRPSWNGAPNQPSTPVANRNKMPESDAGNSAANSQKRSLIPDIKDTTKCQQNFSLCTGFSYYPS